MTIDRAAMALALAFALVYPAGGTAAAQDPARRAGAWDRSVAAEQANDLPLARAELVVAYGENPDSYEVVLRLAWLNLRQRKGTEAATMYRRAALLEGAGPEAMLGLADALTMIGFDALARGDRAAARMQWLEALRVSPSNADARRGLGLIGPVPTVVPEVWGAYLTASPDSSSAPVVYVHVPVQATDRVGFRVAYRHINSTAEPLSPGETPDSTPLFGQQDEIYGGVTFDRSYLTTQVMGFALNNPLGTVPGGAISLRAGARYGVILTAAAMERTAGTNSQILPQVYAWPTPHVGLTAGVRLTRDPEGSSESAVLGATFVGGRAMVDVEGHYGTERWAFSMAGPTVFSIAASSEFGGKITAGYKLSREASVYVQAQYEHITQPDAGIQDGRYTGLAVGLRWSPMNRKKDGR